MVIIGFPVGLPRSWVSFQDSQRDYSADPKVFFAGRFDRPVKKGDRVFLYETDGPGGMDSFGFVGTVLCDPRSRGYVDVQIDTDITFRAREWDDEEPQGTPEGWRSHPPDQWQCRHLSISGDLLTDVWCAACHGYMQPV